MTIIDTAARAAVAADAFRRLYIGTDGDARATMLAAVDVQSVDDLMARAVPGSIRADADDAPSTIPGGSAAGAASHRSRRRVGI